MAFAPRPARLPIILRGAETAFGRLYKRAKPLESGDDMGRSKMPKSRAKALLLERCCLELRIKGYTYEQMGEELGVSTVACYKATKRGMESLTEENRAEAKHLYDIELSRLERAYKAISHRVESGELRAVDTAIRLSQRLGKLAGIDRELDKPLSVNISTEKALAVERIADALKGAETNDSDTE